MDNFDIERFPVSSAAKRMLSYVSEDFYEKSYVGKWLYQVMGMEWDDARRILEEELPQQFFPETATWGLKYHEMKWGLPIREGLPYAERRKLVCQKRDCQMPMTPYWMEKYLEKIVDARVYVTDANDQGQFGYEYPHPNMFRVTVVGAAGLDVGAVQDAVGRLRQSHTDYVVSFLEGRYEAAHCTYMAVVPQSRKIYEVEVC